MASDEDTVRIRLEGRVELLEATLLRYRALQLQVLNALRWKHAVRRHAPLVREVASVQDQVDEALAVVERRAKAEGWKPRSTVVRCAKDVAQLRAAISARVEVLLGTAAGASALGARLLELERLAVESPRLILPGQRMSAAAELLPATLPELKAVAKFGALLERVFKRPDGPARLMPFEPGDLALLEAGFAAGEAALAQAWARVDGVDAAGTLRRHLLHLARRMPTHPPTSGTEQLLAAEFWKSYGLSRLTRLVEARITPVELRPGELLVLGQWLWHVERDGAYRLPPSPPLTVARAALLELARVLGARPPGRSTPAREWDQLEQHAEAAESEPLDADGVRLADNLRLLLRVVSNEKPRAKKGPDESSLRALVLGLRKVAAV